MGVGLLELSRVLRTSSYSARFEGKHTVGPVFSNSCFEWHPAFYGMIGKKSMYIPVYFMAAPPYVVCNSNFELFTACFDTFEDNKTIETTG